MAEPMSDDNDTKRIQALLAEGGSALAHRKDLVEEINKEACRVRLLNALLKKSADQAEAELREAKAQLHEAKAQIAVKDDALSEMRAEYPAMRKLLGRTWGFLKSRQINIPRDLRMAYNALMVPDWHDWQGRNGLRTDSRVSGQNRDKTKKERVGPYEQMDKVKAGKRVGKLELQNSKAKVKIEEQEEGTVVKTEPESDRLSSTQHGRVHDGANHQLTTMQTASTLSLCRSLRCNVPTSVKPLGWTSQQSRSPGLIPIRNRARV
jgi:hypothetical protein